jgi:hypothetical protein
MMASACPKCCSLPFQLDEVSCVLAPVEDIPDVDRVSRWIFAPRVYDDNDGIKLDLVFEFPSSKEYPKGANESVMWSRYADENEVHRLGCDAETRMKARKPATKYMGCVCTTAGAIRAIVNGRGYCLAVNHAPGEGIAHAEVSYSSNDPAAMETMQRSDRNELKIMIKKILGPLLPHDCDAGQQRAAG